MNDSKLLFVILACFVSAIICGCTSDDTTQKAAIQPITSAEGGVLLGDSGWYEYVKVNVEYEEPRSCKVTVRNTGSKAIAFLKPDLFSYMPPWLVFARFRVVRDGRSVLLPGTYGYTNHTPAVVHSQLPGPISKWERITLLPSEEYVYRISTKKFLAGVEVPPDCATSFEAWVNVVCPTNRELTHEVLGISKELPFKDW